MESTTEVKCSFCDKGRNEVSQMVEGPQHTHAGLYICNECVDVTHALLHTPPVEVDDEKLPGPDKKRKWKTHTPPQIKAYLDEYIIGQDSAKIAISVAIYNHSKRINNTTPVVLDKSNLLMVGSSGCGKTMTVKTVAELFDMPYVIADATTLTEAGYVGEDAESIINRLIQNADGDIERAQHGIVFIDEIDKKGRKDGTASVGRDVSGEGVQQALLKLMEGTVLEVEDGFGDTAEFNTKDVLFIFSGAFVGLDEIVRKNKYTSAIGIGASLTTKVPFAQAVKNVGLDDFVKYGLIPEFVGRCPITVVFDDLTTDTLVRILKEPKNSIVSQFKTLFKYDGVTLDFDDKYLTTVAEECLKHKVGARGLRTIMEKTLQETQFHLPRLSKSGVKNILVDASGNINHVYKTAKQVNKKQ